MDNSKIARYADLQGVSVAEFAARVTRYADGFPPAFDQAASDTAGLDAAEVARMARASAQGRDTAYAAALAEIAEDRRKYPRKPADADRCTYDDTCPVHTDASHLVSDDERLPPWLRP